MIPINEAAVTIAEGLAQSRVERQKQDGRNRAHAEQHKAYVAELREAKVPASFHRFNRQELVTLGMLPR